MFVLSSRARPIDVVKTYLSKYLELFNSTTTAVRHCQCQEKTRGGSDDKRKGGERMKMSDETRCKVQEGKYRLI